MAGERLDIRDSVGQGEGVFRDTLALIERYVRSAFTADGEVS